MLTRWEPSHVTLISAAMDFPTKVKALVLRKGDASKSKPVLHDAVLDSVALRKPEANEVVIKIVIENCKGSCDIISSHSTQP